MSRPSAYRTLLARRRHNIRRFLGESGLTQLDLAERMGVSESYISQLLGARPCRPITERTRIRIEVALKLPQGRLDERD